MPITCPRCLRSLSADDAPAFCMHCGQKLRADTVTLAPPPPAAPDAGTRTTSFNPNTASGETAIPEPAPREIGGFRLLRFLGSGGMGTVYEAESESGARVALKLLSSRLSANPSSVERFKQEGRLASQLSHPRCVFVIAADTDAGRPYIVMELMPGRTLKDLVDKRGPLPADEAVRHVLDAIDGLAEAHRLGVLHRDMKPSNCFLTPDGRVKVGDFGLSKSLIGSRDQQLTQSGAFLGTVLFASPEQIRGEPLDYSSDVYSVCATLYYLLCGEAPYQHDSITAALAKAISEPPPPIHWKRPDVPRGLEKVVMTGLERDRDRRFESLDDLREALAAQLPDKQKPARPRVLVGAYLLDVLFLLLVVGLPMEVLDSVFGGSAFAALAVGGAGLYFAVLEGRYGTTAGKALLGLRVRRVGQSGPPGVGRAALRTLVFHVLLVGAVFGGPLVNDLFRHTAAGRVVAAIGVIASLASLLSQLLKRRGFRGVHDLASGCHVTQRPRRPRKLRLHSAQPSPLDGALPETPDPLPETIGGYAVRGRIWDDGAGRQVWNAEDRALGRKVLLWLRAGGSYPVLSAPPEVSRPSRLRQLGHGRLTWAGRGYDWTAFGAPAGAPLADTINPARPLLWADARFLLEQLTDEIVSAEADGSLPKELCLGNVWVEPNGRVQLLEFPVPNIPDDAADADPLVLLRRVASLTLEGRPRTTPDGVRAPLPPHAVPMLNKLFAPGGFASAAAFQTELMESHAHPPEVTPSMRAAHLGLQAAGLAPGLALLLVLTGVIAVVLAYAAGERAVQAEAMIEALHDPEKRIEVGKIKAAERALKNTKAATDRLTALRDRKRAEADRRRAALLAPQRFGLEQMEGALRADSAANGKMSPHAQRDLLEWAGAAEKSRLGKAKAPWRDGVEAIWLVTVIPLVWVVTAAAFRGGPTMALAGVALVRADGRPAFRRQCALRAAVVWLPLIILLGTSVALQVYSPQQPWAYVVPLILALGLLPVYVVVALRDPSRPPQDRIAGTYLVPA